MAAVVLLITICVGLPGDDKAASQPEEAAIERSRVTVRLLDNVYKQTIVLVTEKYVHDEDDYSEGSALVLLFCQGSPVHNVAISLKQFVEQLECERRRTVGLIVGGYSFSIRKQSCGVVVSGFHVTWCGSCRVMPDRPSWDEFQSLLPGNS